MFGVFQGGGYSPVAGGPSLLFNESFTAGSDVGPPAYIGYGDGFLGSISNNVLGSYIVAGLVDDHTNSYFMVVINTFGPDPGIGFLTDVLIDDVSIWSELQGYDFGSLGGDLAVWYFNLQGIVDSTVYDVKLWG